LALFLGFGEQYEEMIQVDGLDEKIEPPVSWPRGCFYGAVSRDMRRSFRIDGLGG
jgi:hypothetical protein